MTGRPDRKTEKKSGKKLSDDRNARNARSKAYMNLAAALATVLSAGVYTKEELQSAVCTYVAEMKDGGETGEGVVRAAQGLVHEVGARFPASQRTQVVLADIHLRQHFLLIFQLLLQRLDGLGQRLHLLAQHLDIVRRSRGRGRRRLC